MTKSTIPTHEWSLPKREFQIDLSKYHKKTYAGIVAISFEGGVELIKVYEKSINQDKFISYLKDIRQKHPFRKLSLFMDNLSVHRAKNTLKKMADLKIKPIFNSPYSPDYNPVEGVIGIGKRKIKMTRLNSIITDQSIDLPSVIV